jgi:hypothetical protein
MFPSSLFNRAAGALGVFCCLAAATQAAAPPPLPSGSHGFDFEFGRWTVHHKVKNAASGAWTEFDGTSETRPILAGLGDVEENVLLRPEGKARGVAVRAFDPKTGEWAIWWIDGRYPHNPLDPPSKGRFEHGVGRFYSDSLVNGRAVRTRLMWSQITANSARWEQADSTDGGRTWATNWIMTFARTSR